MADHDPAAGECPRCGTPYGPRQEYCLECGLRLPVTGGVVGIIVMFFLPWVGIPVGVVGLILLIVYLAGWGRRAAQSQP